MPRSQNKFGRSLRRFCTTRSASWSAVALGMTRRLKPALYIGACCDPDVERTLQRARRLLLLYPTPEDDVAGMITWLDDLKVSRDLEERCLRVA